jgi:hypothetical protein
LDVFGQLDQNRLYGIAVLRQESCQPLENIEQNQQLMYCSGLSSVDWVTTTTSEVIRNSKLIMWWAPETEVEMPCAMGVARHTCSSLCSTLS